MTRVLAYYPYDALALDDPAFVANYELMIELS